LADLPPPQPPAAPPAAACCVQGDRAELLVAQAGGQKAPSGKRPNILFIMGDAMRDARSFTREEHL
jgi:hypothetical protein